MLPWIYQNLEAAANTLGFMVCLDTAYFAETEKLLLKVL